MSPNPMSSELQASETATLPVLSARDIKKQFGSTDALRGVSTEITAGEVVAIMGPSGSGKSTLLHCLGGIIVPDSGAVLYRGLDIVAITEHERTRLRLSEFGFVFQFGQLVPDLPAVENVALPLLLRGEHRRTALEQGYEWLKVLGLDGVGGKMSGELSGGQAQRVALARAFAIHPRVIFADEPTGSLDSLSGESVMELMTGMARELGTTIVLVTHDVRIAAYADREIMVRDGRITSDAGLS